MNMDKPLENSPEITIDLLALVTEQNIPLEEVLSWTEEERELACEWAAAVHCHASDNPDVEVPPIPEKVKAAQAKYPKREQDGIWPVVN